ARQEADGREEVLRVVRADQWALDVDQLRRERRGGAQAKSQSVEAALYLLGDQRGAGRSARSETKREGNFASQPGNPFVVEVQHRRRSVRKQLAEELRLGFEVRVHRAVVVEMIARQVGECGSGEDASGRALLRERVT